jgi:hypothetical protein
MISSFLPFLLLTALVSINAMTYIVVLEDLSPSRYQDHFLALRNQLDLTGGRLDRARGLPLISNYSASFLELLCVLSS